MFDLWGTASKILSRLIEAKLIPLLYRLIATTGSQNRGIDTGYAAQKGVVVSGTNNKGASTVEHIWALILSAAREIPREHNNIRSANPQWQTTVPFGLYGKTLGLVGLGRLGSRVAEVRK